MLPWLCLLVKDLTAILLGSLKFSMGLCVLVRTHEMILRKFVLMFLDSELGIFDWFCAVYRIWRFFFVVLFVFGRDSDYWYWYGLWLFFFEFLMGMGLNE